MKICSKALLVTIECLTISNAICVKYINTSVVDRCHADSRVLEYLELYI